MMNIILVLLYIQRVNLMVICGNHGRRSSGMAREPYVKLSSIHVYTMILTLVQYIKNMQIRGAAL